MSIWFGHFLYEFQSRDEGAEIIGAKAQGLKSLVRLNIPTPPGIIINNDFAKQYLERNILPEGFMSELKCYGNLLEKHCGCAFGDARSPLFVSVRSSPCVSMPGLLPTVLNVGLVRTYLKTDLVRLPGFLDNYGNWLLTFLRITNMDGANAIDWPEVWSLEEIQKLIAHEHLRDCAWLDDPWLQIRLAAEHILRTFELHTKHGNNHIMKISRSQPPGIIIQKMVWGNSSREKSGTGVVFTRNPQTGEDELFGDYAANHLGEHLVSGKCSAIPLWHKDSSQTSMQKLMPEIFQELQQICHRLERYYGYMQDIEFTVDGNKLWILQTRNGRCNPQAHMKITMDLLQEKRITLQEAVKRISAEDVAMATKSTQASYAASSVLAQGQSLCQGAVSGFLCFDAKDVDNCLQMKRNAILVGQYPSDIDMNMLKKVQGLMTVFGASTSHLAVVARGLGLPFIANMNMRINWEDKSCDFTLNEQLKPRIKTMNKAQPLTINGDTGEVVEGECAVSNCAVHETLYEFLHALSDHSQVQVLANINIAQEVDLASEMKAAGIGLCRTEHLINTQDLVYLQAYCLSSCDKVRKDCLQKLACSYESYFDRLLGAMDDLPVVIRLLDAPLYEFLPKNKQQMEPIQSYCGESKHLLGRNLESFANDGGMLGLRGIRFGIVYPDFYRMQVEAAMRSWRKSFRAQVKILLPFVSFLSEVQNICPLIQDVHDALGPKDKVLPIGVMLETPAALMIADNLAKQVQFFSFGTNDLSQLVFGISREDSGLLERYRKAGILDQDIFLNIQNPSILLLMQIACQKARAVNPEIEIGFCGEGEMTEDCVEFLYEQKINYLSCSVNKIPAMQFKMGKIGLFRNTKT